MIKSFTRREWYSANEERVIRIISTVIFLNAVLFGIDACLAPEDPRHSIIERVDNIFFGIFFLEIIFRLSVFNIDLKLFRSALGKLFHTSITVKPAENEKKSLERTFWILFDGTILLGSLIAIVGSSLVDDKEVIFLFRSVRLLRILKIFGFQSQLRRIERRILSIIPVVFYFGVLLILIMFVYAVIGAHLYRHTKFSTLDFTNLKTGLVSLFVIVTNGWAGALDELRAYKGISVWVSELYLVSYFIAAAMVTLNVFISVMTSIVFDKVQEEVSMAAFEEKERLEKMERLERKYQKQLLRKISDLDKKMAAYENKIRNN
jgi:hypothetical protein